MASGARSTEEADGRRATALIRACLRAEAPAWPAGAGPELGEAVLEQCGVHGVGALVYEHLGSAQGWPRQTLERLREQAAAAAMWEAHHRRILARALAALAGRGIEPVLLKGTALAYACYPDPALRARSDTDLLIPAEARDEADAALRELGFARATGVSGELISYQASYQTDDPLGLAHVIDLHWRVNNSELLARLFSHAELRARAVPVPALGGMATCPVDALLIACMHREVHRRSPYWVEGVAHFSADRLIWLYDLQLLAGALGPAERDELARLAHRKGLAAVCRDGLARAAEVLGTGPAPAGTAELLRALEPGGRAETPHAYLHASGLRQQYMNFRALAGLGAKLRFLGELAVPPAAYMRARYGDVRPAWLPWLYLRRALRGSAGRLAGRLWGSRAP